MRVAAKEDLKLRLEKIAQLPFLFFLLGEFFGRPIGQDDWEHAFAVAVQLLVVEVGPDARSHEEGDAAAALDIIFQVLGSALIQLRHVEEIDAGIFFQVGALKLIDAAALYLETPRCREERL